jgi:DMSO/TMAO reductase YedYZ molybdopterin-dependent catalytic subunit
VPWRPPGPFRRRTWRSPLRGAWLSSLLGLVLLFGMSIVALTGFLSYAAYNPRLGNNDLTPGAGLLRFYLFDWPTSPAWLYRVTQGTHVILGIVLVPVVLAKLWSVAPKLYEWPPVRSVAQALERINITLIIGSALFQLATGILNVQYDYIWGFSFYDAHFYGAWVFIASFAAHTAIKFPTMIRSLRERTLNQVPEPQDPDELAPPDPDPPTLSRRTLLAWIGGSSALLLLLTVGQTLGGAARRLALLAPRGRIYGDGPNDFQVNQTAEEAGIRRADVGPSWRLELVGRRRVALDRSQLLAMSLHTEELPIACVEGWSTVETWRGVRLVDLADLVGSRQAPSVLVESIEQGGAFSSATLSGDQVREERSLLALEVNGADLSLDHGFPARVIVPANPGVHNTKWVRRMTFAGPDG